MRIILVIIFTGIVSLFSVQTAAAQNSSVVITGTVKKSYNGNDISCKGSNDAEITVTATGGSGEYQYSKNNGQTWQTSNVLTGLATGNILVKARDAKNISNATQTLYVWVNDVNAVQIVTWVAKTNYNGKNNISCNGYADGALEFGADGGNGKFLYSIDNGENWQKETYFAGLPAGSYQGVVKDQNGCTAKTNVAIKLTEPAPIEGVIVSQKLADPGKNNGTLTVMGKGGDGGYDFVLEGFSSSGWVANASSFTFNNLPAKQYNLVVRDLYYNFGCTSKKIDVVTGKLIAEISGSATVCAGRETALKINIISKEAGRFTVIYKDSRNNKFTLNNATTGMNVVTVGPVNAGETYTLFSVKDSTGTAGTITGSASIQISQDHTWKGKTSEWTESQNWTCDIVPTVETDVLIPLTTNNPEITIGNNGVRNITFESNALLSVFGSLKISGEVSGIAAIDASAGNLEFVGQKAQHISGNAFRNRLVKNLKISNPAGLYVNGAAGDTLNISGNLTFGSADAKLFTGDNITLKSTANGTANLGYVGVKNLITGKMTVERFFNLGTDKSKGQHAKAWMLVATPVKGQSIRNSWQEGGVSTGKTPIADPHKGYGTLLTTGYNKVPVNGFDLFTSPGPSIKTFNSEQNAYDKGPVSTSEELYNPKGYLVLVRGDRSVYTSNAKPIPTVLRATGEVITGTTMPVTVSADRFESVGNPYPAAISLQKITRKDVDDVFFVWDPKLGGSYGLGAYQTLVSMFDGTYMAIPGGGSYGSDAVRNIESGMAFLVQTTKRAGTIQFTEDAKLTSSSSVQRMQGSGKMSQFRSWLFGMGTGEPVLVDGNLIQFDPSFSSEIDGMDARKAGNTSESFSIQAQGINLAAERRQPFTAEDTIYFRLSGLQYQAYQFKFSGTDLGKPGMEARLEDAYLQTSTPVKTDGETIVNFQVENKAGSYASDRFRIVFNKPQAPLPVTLTSLTAVEKNANVQVRWTVENESNMASYTIERSEDGKNFYPVQTMSAKNKVSGEYNWQDENPAAGFHYYRLKSIGFDGEMTLSSIVKINTGKGNASLVVYPNPAVNSTVKLELKNQPSGVYYYRLLNPLGQTIKAGNFTSVNGAHQEQINWNRNSARGSYQLQVTLPDGEAQNFTIIY